MCEQAGVTSAEYWLVTAVAHEKHAAAHEMTAEALLKVLQEKDLVPADVLKALRKQVAEAKTPVSARRLAALLVDKKLLTAPLAERLLAAQKPAAPSPAKSEPGAAASGVSSLLDEELPPLGTGLPPLTSSPLDAMFAEPALLDSAAEGPALAPAAPVSAAPLAPPAPPRKDILDSLAKSLRRLRRRVPRRSPWLWGGVAAASLLILLGLAAALFGRRRDPNELLRPADASYENGSYAEAVEGYQEYLERFPRHQSAGRARVRQGLARLLAASSAPADPAAALAAAQEILPVIGPEAEFPSEAGPILAAVLPRIGEDLIAEGRLIEASLAQADELLAAASLYTPAKDRPLERLGRIEAAVAVARHKAARDPGLHLATAAIRQALADKDFPRAFQARSDLLARYPELAQHKELARADREIAEAARSKVAWVARRRPAEKDQPPGPLATTVLSSRSFKAAAPGAEGHTLLATTAGTLYGLHAATGKVLWCKFLGHEADRRAALSISPQPGSDLVLAVAARAEVERVKAADGKPLWRHDVGEPFCAEPVLGGQQVLVAASSGRLVSIDAATGDSPGFVQLPQPLRVRRPSIPGAGWSSSWPTRATCSCSGWPTGNAARCFPSSMSPARSPCRRLSSATAW